MSDNDLPQIRTYQGDMADALEEQKESLVSIRAKELRRNDGSALNPEKKRIYSNIFFFIAGIIFILLGSVGGYLTYNKYKVETAVPTISAPSNRFIPVDEEKTLYVTGHTRESFIEAVLNESRINIEPGRIKQLVWKKGLATDDLQPVTEFLLLLDARVPESFVRNLERDYMLGLIGASPPETFLILKTNSYENAYAGMLAWEENLPEDLLPMFAPEASLFSSTTAAFTDLTIKNKDVRVLKDQSGAGIFFYTFYNQDYIVFAESEETLKTLLSKLDSATLKR